MITVVVFDKETREVIAAIPIKNGEPAVCRNDVEFQIFNGTEPVFAETEQGITLAENIIIINPREDL